MTGEEVGEGLLDIGLVVVYTCVLARRRKYKRIATRRTVGVDVEEAETTQTTELVEQIALLTSTGVIAAGNEHAGELSADVGRVDGEEIESLEAIAQHG